mgnify:CR=1 FL=1
MILKSGVFQADSDFGRWDIGCVVSPSGVLNKISLTSGWLTHGRLLFFSREKRKVVKRKHAPDVALFLRFAPLPSSSPTVHPCTEGEAWSPDRAPSGLRAKAGDARGRHTGVTANPNFSASPDPHDLRRSTALLNIVDPGFRLVYFLISPGRNACLIKSTTPVARPFLS